MSRSDEIASFIFKGLIAQNSFSEKKLSVSQNLTYEKISKRVSIDLFEKEILEQSKKMSAVYIAISSFENMLRGIITEKLISEKGEGWWQSNSISQSIRSKAERKLEDEKKHRWHTPRGSNLIYFTELKDLVSIITNDKNWTFFEDLFGNMDWVKHSVKSIERSRNVIMHSGYLSIEDIERIGIIIRDWMRQLGE